MKGIRIEHRSVSTDRPEALSQPSGTRSCSGREARGCWPSVPPATTHQTRAKPADTSKGMGSFPCTALALPGKNGSPSCGTG